VPSKRADYFYRTRVAVIRISVSPSTCQTDLRVPPTCPVNSYSNFVFCIVQIDDDLLYQDPSQPLLGSHRRAGLIPGRCQVVSECQ
jgi:hypothetical protein